MPLCLVVERHFYKHKQTLIKMKTKFKKAYVVRGSEDGIIGVYTNVKLAFEACMAYMELAKEQNSYMIASNYDRVTPSYSEALKQKFYFAVHGQGHIEASSEIFYLNDPVGR